MLKIILTGATAYISTSIDYLIILMLIFYRTKTRNQKISVYIGDLLGTSVLVLVSLILAFLLHLIPADWILGLLGLIPITMGVRLLLGNDDDDSDLVNGKLKDSHRIITNVAVITIATCGADNIGIYVPYFVTLSKYEIIIVLLTFLIMLTIFFLLGYGLVKLPPIANFLEQYGRWITAIVYILIGLYIMIESGTITKLISLI